MLNEMFSYSEDSCYMLLYSIISIDFCMHIGISTDKPVDLEYLYIYKYDIVYTCVQYPKKYN